MSGKKFNLYFVSVLLFMLLLPLVSVIINSYQDGLPLNLPHSKSSASAAAIVFR